MLTIRTLTQSVLKWHDKLNQSHSTRLNYEIAQGGGEDSAYERGGDARREFWIKPLKESYLGVAQAFFVP